MRGYGLGIIAGTACLAVYGFFAETTEQFGWYVLFALAAGSFLANLGRR